MMPHIRRPVYDGGRGHGFCEACGDRRRPSPPSALRPSRARAARCRFDARGPDRARRARRAADATSAAIRSSRSCRGASMRPEHCAALVGNRVITDASSSRRLARALHRRRAVAPRSTARRRWWPGRGTGRGPTARRRASDRRTRARRARTGRRPESRRRRCPRSFMARRNPRLVITVTTTVSLRSRPRSCRSTALMAMIWSPSTSAPLRSTASTRSASPSNASPASAPWSTTARCRSPGWVEPQPSLMLVPLGSAWSTTTRRSEPAQHMGRDGRRRPVGAVDHEPHTGQVPRRSTARPPRRRRAGAQGWLRPCRSRRRWATSPARGCPCTSASSVASSALSTSSSSLRPVGTEELDAVVGVAVVRRGDHRPRRAGRRRRPRHRRCRDHAEGADRRPFGGQPRGERGFERRTGDARVAADDEAIDAEHTAPRHARARPPVPA